MNKDQIEDAKEKMIENEIDTNLLDQKMTKEKQNDIATALDGIDIAIETIHGALKDIDGFKADIHDILNGETGDEKFLFNTVNPFDGIIKSLSESPRI